MEHRFLDDDRLHRRKSHRLPCQLKMVHGPGNRTTTTNWRGRHDRSSINYHDTDELSCRRRKIRRIRFGMRVIGDEVGDLHRQYWPYEDTDNAVQAAECYCVIGCVWCMMRRECARLTLYGCVGHKEIGRILAVKRRCPGEYTLWVADYSDDPGLF